MCRHHNKKPEEDSEFSIRNTVKHMILPGILCGLIGLCFGWRWLLLCGAAGALLGGIEYCDRFDDD